MLQGIFFFRYISFFLQTFPLHLFILEKLQKFSTNFIREFYNLLRFCPSEFYVMDFLLHPGERKIIKFPKTPLFKMNSPTSPPINNFIYIYTSADAGHSISQQIETSTIECRLLIFPLLFFNANLINKVSFYCSMTDFSISCSLALRVYCSLIN